MDYVILIFYIRYIFSFQSFLQAMPLRRDCATLLAMAGTKGLFR
jgi:hypothetical protein